MEFRRIDSDLGSCEYRQLRGRYNRTARQPIIKTSGMVYLSYPTKRLIFNDAERSRAMYLTNPYHARTHLGLMANHDVL